MCDPSGVVIAASVASALSVVSDSMQGKQQNASFKQNQKNSIRAGLDAYDTQGAQANERRDQAGQSATRNALDAARARASISNQSSESNLSGLSVDALVAEVDRQEGVNNADLAANEAFGADQRVREGKGIRSSTQGRINSAPRGSFNPVIGLLQIGADTGIASANEKQRQRLAGLG